MFKTKPFLRDSKGRFIKGTAHGPGRRRVETKKENKPPVNFKTLREYWLAFRAINILNTQNLLRCSKCGNCDPERFIYPKYDKVRDRLAVKCLCCGCWTHYRKISELFYPMINRLSKEDVAAIAIQRLAGGEKSGDDYGGA
jgi:hypothetical protein